MTSFCCSKTFVSNSTYKRILVRLCILYNFFIALLNFECSASKRKLRKSGALRNSPPQRIAISVPLYFCSIPNSLRIPPLCVLISPPVSSNHLKSFYFSNCKRRVRWPTRLIRRISPKITYVERIRPLKALPIAHRPFLADGQTKGRRKVIKIPPALEFQTHEKKKRRNITN